MLEARYCVAEASPTSPPLSLLLSRGSHAAPRSHLPSNLPLPHQPVMTVRQRGFYSEHLDAGINEEGARRIAQVSHNHSHHPLPPVAALTQRSHRIQPSLQEIAENSTCWLNTSSARPDNCDVHHGEKLVGTRLMRTRVEGVAQHAHHCAHSGEEKKTYRNFNTFPSPSPPQPPGPRWTTQRGAATSRTSIHGTSLARPECDAHGCVCGSHEAVYRSVYFHRSSAVNRM